MLVAFRGIVLVHCGHCLELEVLRVGLFSEGHNYISQLGTSHLVMITIQRLVASRGVINRGFTVSIM